MAEAFPVAQRDGILSENIDGQLEVVDSRTQQAHALPSLAATVWSLCDGNHSVAAIGARTGFSPDQVTDVLAQLRERDLLETAGTDKAIDRRAMLTRTAKLGGAAALTTPILTVALPAAAEASSTSASYYVSFDPDDSGNPDDSGGVTYVVTSYRSGTFVYSTYDGDTTNQAYAPATLADQPLSSMNVPFHVAYVTIAVNSDSSLTLTLVQYNGAGSATFTTPDGTTTYDLTGSSPTANPLAFTSGNATLVVSPT